MKTGCPMSQTQASSLFKYKFFLAADLVLLAAAEILPLLMPSFGAPPLHATLIYSLLTNDFMAAVLLGSFVIYVFLLRDRLWETAAVTAGGIIAEVFMHYGRMGLVPYDQLWVRWGCGFGCAALAACILRLIFCAEERAKVLPVFVLAATLPVWEAVIPPLHVMCGANVMPMNGQVLDFATFYVDGLLGFQPSFAAASACLNHAWLGMISIFVYAYLGLWMSLALLEAYRNPENTAVSPLLVYMLVGTLGMLAYRYFPVVGTQAMCGRAFPLGPVPVVEDPGHLVEAPDMFSRNAMPSLHMAWILSALWAMADRRGVMRWVMIALTLLTMLGTLDVGHHYAADLAMAVPFTLFCYALSVRNIAGIAKAKIIAALLGGTVFMSLLSIGRFFPACLVDNPIAVWGTLAASAVLSFFVKGRLDKAYFALQTADSGKPADNKQTAEKELPEERPADSN